MKTILYPEQETEVQKAVQAYLEREEDKYICPYRYIVNFSELGRGKSLMTIAVLERLGYLSNTDSGLKRVLVLGPKALIPQWQKIFDDIILEYELDTLEIDVMNWERFRDKIDITIMRYDVVILDEFHKLKNRKAQITQKVLNLRRKYADTLFIGLTGTPVLNKAVDLWSLFNCLGVFGRHPEYNGWNAVGVRSSYWEFAQRYYEFKYNGFANEFKGYRRDTFEELTSMINDRICPIHVTDVQQTREIQKKRYIQLLLMHPEQKAAYDSIKNLMYEEMPPDLHVSNALTQLLRLLQCTSAPPTVGVNVPGIKFEWIRLYLQTSIDKSVVIFSRFSSVLEALKGYLHASGIEVEVYCGDTPTKKRKELVDAFCEGRTRIFLATIGSAGFGIDGLQHVSNTMIFIDRDWSPSVNDQAEARLCRIGQQASEVHVYNLQCVRSIDQYVEKMIDRKELTIQQLMDKI